jgi:hypothetical protein
MTMTDLLERYLQAVGRHLSARSKNDTLQELRANLLAEMDDRAEVLGRPLTEAEEAEVLRGHGYPSIVAARYQPQRSLIGPEIFPIYWYTMGKALPWVIGLVVLSRVIEAIYGPPQEHMIVDSLGKLFSVLFYFFSWMTLTFAAIDFGCRFYPKKVTLLADWDPRKLPKVEPEPKDNLPKNPVAELILRTLGLLWLLALPGHPYLFLGPGAWYVKQLPFGPAPVLHTFYWAVVWLNCLQIVLMLVALLQGARPWRQWMKFVEEGVGLVPLVILMRASEYVVFVRPAADAGQLELVVALNLWIHRGLQVVATIVALKLVWNMWELVRDSFAGRNHRRTAGDLAVK